MHTDILTPKDLFQKDVRYTIPPFQRPYVWSQDDQWEPLWEDVRNVAENYLEELERSGNNGVEAEQKTGPHFLGAIVLKQVPTAAKEIDQREVIDGQQRVTTLQLLLDAIQQIYEESDQPYTRKAARRLAKLVTNDEELIEDDNQIFKLWPTRGDREAFRHAMDNGLAANDFEESLIVQAHEFFKLQARKWLQDAAGPIESRIDALEAAATSMLQMVVIDLSPQDDPNLIFETLNARGTRLEQSDLIKNFVLSQERDRHGDTWGNLDDAWWRREARQGRLLRPRLDMLLNYWLAMRKGAEVSPLGVFNEFRSYVGDQEVHAVMSEVKQDLMNYREFESTRGRSPEEKSFYYHVDVMQAGVITPVLLLLLSAEEGTRIRAFTALESFLVRRMICRRTTKDYNRLVLELANRLRENGLDGADAVTAGFLREQIADARVWPSDQDVDHAMDTSPLYRLLTRGRLRLVLEGAERRLRSSGKSEQTDVPRNLTIEHLMPTGWRKEEWPLPEGVDTDAATYERNTLIHSIGNLTLATQKLNSSMSNAPWKSKRDELQGHSVLLLNNELLTRPTWNEEAIRSRSRRVAELVSARWPGPTSEEWSEIK